MKKSKLWMILATGSLCVGLLAAAVACGGNNQGSEENALEVSGSVLFLQEGAPERRFGGSGDVCIVTSTGTIYRKDGTEWQQTAFEEYTVNGERLQVTYSDGTVGTYELASPQADRGTNSACAHASFGEVKTIYPSLCVVPGIGVKTCTECHESFVEILPADPANHRFNRDNYGRCDICAHVSSGVVGYEASDSEQLKELFQENKLEDGDTVVLQGGAEIHAEDELHIEENTDITLDVHGQTFDFQKDKNSLTGAKTNIEVGPGGSLTVTDSSDDHSGSFDITVTEEGGNYIWTGQYDTSGNKIYRRGAVSVLAKGTADNRAQLSFENVEVNINDVNMMNLVINSEYADVTLGEGTVFNIEGVAYTGAVYAGDGATVTIDGAEINTQGDVTPFVVGDWLEDATLNFKSGSINMNDPSDRMFGIQVNGAGHVNMSGGEINITGDLRSTDDTHVAVAIGVDNRRYAEWIDEHNTGLGYKWNCVEATIDITGGSINLAPTHGTAYGVVTWPGNPVINISGMTILGNAPAAEGEGVTGACTFALCCAELDGTVAPQMYLGDGLKIQLAGTGRNLLFSTRENGGDGISFDWKASGSCIFDKTADKIFGEAHAEEYGGQFVQPYTE